MSQREPRAPGATDLFDRIGRINLAIWIVIGVGGAVVFNPFFLLVPLVLPAIQSAAGRIARTVYDPTGSRVPSKSAYSQPESLAVRGRFQEAIDAYELAARDEPGDPQPWLRIARIERADMKRPERALEALRAARTRVTLESPTGQMILREIAEIQLREMGDPTRAMPELARLAAAFPHTPTGQWAATELAGLKKNLDR
jgi:hypothetical protein